MKMRYIIPVFASAMTVMALGHTSASPTVFRRYSIDYTLLLVSIFIWTAVAFRITLNEEKFSRLFVRLGRVPIMPIGILAASLVIILIFFTKDLNLLLHFLDLNVRVVGMAFIISSTLLMLILANENLKAGLVNYALLLSSCLIALLLIEVGVRIVAYRHNQNIFDHSGQAGIRISAGEEATLGQIIRVAKNPRIIYEFVPDLSVVFQGRSVTINEAGFRGERVPVAKAENALRIVGLGDSIMFGWGVDELEGFLSVLKGLLGKEYPHVQWDIVNTAVPGYNTAMEVAAFKEKGLQYSPDLVLINYVGNDLEIPNFIRKPENYRSWRISFLRQYMDQAARRNEINIGLVDAPVDFVSGGFVRNPEQVPEEYRDMVGVGAYKAAMQELADLSKQYRFDVIVVAQKLLPQFVKEICAELDFPTVETAPAWAEYVRANNLRDEGSAWRLSADDPHPSALGHRIIAEAIFAHLIEQGSVEARLHRE